METIINVEVMYKRKPLVFCYLQAHIIFWWNWKGPTQTRICLSVIVFQSKIKLTIFIILVFLVVGIFLTSFLC